MGAISVIFVWKNDAAVEIPDTIQNILLAISVLTLYLRNKAFGDLSLIKTFFD